MDAGLVLVEVGEEVAASGRESENTRHPAESELGKGAIVNQVALVGNLCSDVELKQIGEDKQVANFRIAVDRPGKDAGADFISVSTWNGSAKACAEFLHKGSKVGVTGSIRTRSWEAEDGSKRYAVEVSASRVEFLTPKGSTPAATEPSTAPPDDDDIPF